MGKFSFFILIIFTVWLGVMQDSLQCGVPIPSGKIVGGVDSGGYHYPWFALLLLRRNSFLPIPICGGSLITETFVLTAAHCFTISLSVSKKDLFSVALGVYNICNEEEKTREIFKMSDVIVHEMYQKKGKFYDIALIKLDRPTDYTVICLPISGVVDLTESALLIGFGVTNENSDMTPCHLLEVNITKYSKMDCLNTKLPLEDRKEPSVICAGELSGNVDSCYGDSGGPLQIKSSDGKYTIAGIVSYGYGCAVPEVPGIYTNVGSYIPWINEKISQSNSPNSGNDKQLNKLRPIARKRTKVFANHTTSVFFKERRIFLNSADSTNKIFHNRKKESSHLEDKKDEFVENKSKNSKIIFPN